MKPPRYVRPLTNGERETDAFTLHRSQILLASARGRRPQEIADDLGCCSQTAGNAIKAFNTDSRAALLEGSHRNHTIHTSFDAGWSGRRHWPIAAPATVGIR